MAGLQVKGSILSIFYWDDLLSGILRIAPL
jgi:hypothetical protein